MDIDICNWGETKPDIYHKPKQDEALLRHGGIVEFKTIQWQGHPLPIRISQDSFTSAKKYSTPYEYVYETTLPFTPQMIDLYVSAMGVPQEEVAQAFYQVLNSVHGQWNAQAVHEPAH